MVRQARSGRRTPYYRRERRRLKHRRRVSPGGALHNAYSISATYSKWQTLHACSTEHTQQADLRT